MIRDRSHRCCGEDVAERAPDGGEHGPRNGEFTIDPPTVAPDGDTHEISDADRHKTDLIMRDGGNDRPTDRAENRGGKPRGDAERKVSLTRSAGKFVAANPGDEAGDGVSLLIR